MATETPERKAERNRISHDVAFAVRRAKQILEREGFKDPSAEAVATIAAAFLAREEI